MRMKGASIRIRDTVVDSMTFELHAMQSVAFEVMAAILPETNFWLFTFLTFSAGGAEAGFGTTFEPRPKELDDNPGKFRSDDMGPSPADCLSMGWLGTGCHFRLCKVSEKFDVI